MRGGGDDVGVGEGGWVDARGDEPGDVGDIRDEQSADLIGRGAEAGERRRVFGYATISRPSSGSTSMGLSVESTISAGSSS